MLPTPCCSCASPTSPPPPNYPNRSRLVNPLVVTASEAARAGGVLTVTVDLEAVTKPDGAGNSGGTGGGGNGGISRLRTGDDPDATCEGAAQRAKRMLARAASEGAEAAAAAGNGGGGTTGARDDDARENPPPSPYADAEAVVAAALQQVRAM